MWNRLIYERCLHLTDKFAYCSTHSNLFLTLQVIHKLKIARNAGGTHYLQLYCKNKHSDLYLVVVLTSGTSMWNRLIYERCLHLTDKFAYCSTHSNLFLTLQVIHKLKIARNAGGTHYLQLYCKNKHSDLYFLSVSSFLHLVCLIGNHVFTCISVRLNSEVSSTRLSSVIY